MTAETNELRDRVRARYAAAAVEATKGSSCGCGPSCCGDGQREDGCCGDDCCQCRSQWRFRRVALQRGAAGELPETAALASLGCGNPTAVAELREGDTVLDLGSGGGIDVILSARRVGPTGAGVRPGHDRRDARSRPAQRGEAGVANSTS